ncbi:MAG: putative collagen-binding domain-containing protein, partial [Pirellulaceae bacterium]
VLGGAASSRFHRPDSGLGLGQEARAHIRSMRLLTTDLDIFRAEPDASSQLLLERDENEAYLTRIEGQQYAVYFPNGGSVRLDLTQAPGTYRQRWLDIAESRWTDARLVQSGGKLLLEPPGPGHWAVLLKKTPSQ